MQYDKRKLVCKTKPAISPIYLLLVNVIFKKFFFISNSDKKNILIFACELLARINFIF